MPLYSRALRRPVAQHVPIDRTCRLAIRCQKSPDDNERERRMRRGHTRTLVAAIVVIAMVVGSIAFALMNLL